VRRLIRSGYGCEEDIELAKVPVETVIEREGIARPIDLGSFDQVNDTIVKHVQNG